MLYSLLPSKQKWGNPTMTKQTLQKNIQIRIYGASCELIEQWSAKTGKKNSSIGQMLVDGAREMLEENQPPQIVLERMIDQLRTQVQLFAEEKNHEAKKAKILQPKKAKKKKGKK